jgi:acetylornithine deacetylase/succinyl-diaminopimelate desuccinylase-like protein
MQKALDYAKSNAAGFQNELNDLIRIPSISTDPAYRSEVKKAADWLIRHLKQIGLTTELIEKEGRHPLVYAQWLGAGETAKTVLIYGHNDVQPAQKSDGWDTEPFEPIEKSGVLYARGSTDDKGQMFAHLKAIESVLRAEGKLPVNVKIILEGEEESGGEHIEAYVPAHQDRFHADVCIISDSSMTQPEQPVILNGLRGNTSFEVTLQGPKQDLHSGAYGGTVQNPIHALVELLGKLHDPQGRVTVPGFYDGVRVLSETERKEIAETQISEEEWRDSTGASQPFGEPGFTLSEQIGARPTLELTGIGGGYFERGFKNIVPQKAWAKISSRLVADQDPATIQKCIIDYLKQNVPVGVTLEISIPNNRAGAPAVLVNTDNPTMQAAIRAYKEGWGAAPVFRREGGSIPIVTIFQNMLKIPVILMGFGLNSDGLHGPNEHFDLKLFHRGIRTSIHFLYEVANM